MSLAEVTRLVTRVSQRKECQEYMDLLRPRANEFDNDVAMRVAAIEMAGKRQLIDDGLQTMFDRAPLGKLFSDEVIIGSGYHATEWALTRRALGFPYPLVLDESTDPGGCFTVCHRAGFRANSRNRPGPLGLPGQGRGLNVLPGALVQPAVLNTDEFQGNDVLAFCNRLALATSARVRPNSKVVKITRNYPVSHPFGYQLDLADGRAVRAQRVIDARGLGTCTHPPNVKFDGDRVMDYNQFLQRLDQPFPFKGWGRVAVVGAGDGANTVIEALLGIGPKQLSNTALDYVPEIDWYGPEVPRTKLDWSQVTRCRYALIASYLPKEEPEFSDSIRDSRVEVFDTRGTVVRGPGGTFVNDRFYDSVIVAIGFTPHKQLFGSIEEDVVTPGDKGTQQRRFPFTNREPSVLCRKVKGHEVYKIGTNAQIDFDSDADKVTEFPQNKVAIFRLIGRTARAAALAGPVPRR